MLATLDSCNICIFGFLSIFIVKLQHTSWNISESKNLVPTVLLSGTLKKAIVHYSTFPCEIILVRGSYPPQGFKQKQSMISKRGWELACFTIKNYCTILLDKDNKISLLKIFEKSLSIVNIFESVKIFAKKLTC